MVNEKIIIENKELEQKKEDEKVVESYQVEFEASDNNPDFGPGQSSSSSSDNKEEKVGEIALGAVLTAASLFPPTAPIAAPTAVASATIGGTMGAIAPDKPNSTTEDAVKRVGKGLEIVGGGGTLVKELKK